MSASGPTVSIVIPVFNCVDLTRSCLEALAETTSGTFEVIVVDNASTDGTHALLARFGSALTVVRNQENEGFARACNAAASRASGKYLVFLNNDTLPRPGWLEALVSTAEGNPGIGVLGPRLLYPDGTVQHAGIGFTADFEPVHIHQGKPSDAPEVLDDRDCEAVTGACLMIPRPLFVELGGFDCGYGMYFEDVDLCLHARAAGYRVRYVAGSVLIRSERRSSATSETASQLNRESHERLRTRWAPTVTPVVGPSGPATDTFEDAVAAPGKGATGASHEDEDEDATGWSLKGAVGASHVESAAASHVGLRVLFQARANLFAQPGGDTVVIDRLMEALAARGVTVSFSAELHIPPGTDVVHTINFATPQITRRFAEEAERAGVPLVVTTLYEDLGRFLPRARVTQALFTAALSSSRSPSGMRQGVTHTDVSHPPVPLQEAPPVPLIDRATIESALEGVSGPPPPSADNEVTAAISRCLLACGESERVRLRADFPAANDVRVVSFGADLHAGRVGSLPSGSFASSHGVRNFILCVGRLEERANQLMLLEALRDDPTPIVLVGAGSSDSSEYARLCRSFKRKGPTVIRERIDSSSLAAAFREAAVHCLPSWYEMPGLVSLEAAFHGTRVAASSWGALADYLGDTIAYLEPDDPGSVRAAIERAHMLDPEVARARARSFTWERAASELLEIYQEVIPIAAPRREPCLPIPLTEVAAAEEPTAVEPAFADADSGQADRAETDRAEAAGFETSRLVPPPDGVRQENLRVLEARAPELVGRITRAEVPEDYVLSIKGSSGKPSLSVAGIAQHHPASPEQDAERWARGAVERLETSGAKRAVVVGLGLGYHLEALAERFSGEIVVVEPDPAIWRLALTARDLSRLLARVTIAASDVAAGGESPAATGGAWDELVSAEPTRVLAYPPALLIAGGAHRRAQTRWQSRAGRSGLRLRVLVVSPIYGGSHPIAGYAARALTALGHEAQLLDLSPFHESLRRLDQFGARKSRQIEIESRFCDVLGSGVVAAVEAMRPDVVLALAQAPLAAAALEQIGRQGALRVLWFVEDFRRFTYWRDVAREYDYVFTIQEADCLEALAACTDARLAYLPCGFDAEIHRPITLGADELQAYGSDISFVGAGYRNRQIALRAFLDRDFKIWGSEWQGANELERVVQRGSARIDTEEAVRIFNASRINLNLHSSTYHDGIDPRGDFVNPRTFEITGCGAFQVVDRRALLSPLFTPGEEIAVASTVAEMRELALDYLARPDARRDMATRARKRALDNHRYEHRMETMLATLLARDEDRLRAKARPALVGDVCRQVDGALQRYLRRFDPATPFRLDRLVEGIAQREGALEEPEAILLFLHQFDELYLQEYRA